jgi:RHS repeat-associated protein
VVTYYHADHLGTLRVTSDAAGQLSSPLVYTAFGEVVAADGSIGGDASGTTRYRYAGAFGYESGLLGSASGISGLPWQHVGYRWYDPSSGRFLQRDPIGTRGGVNVYVYAANMPTMRIDPRGRMPEWLANAILGATDWAYPRGWQAEQAAVDNVTWYSDRIAIGAAALASGGMLAEFISPGVLYMGYGGGSFYFSTSPAGRWLLGDPNSGSIVWALYDVPWFQWSVPVRFPDQIQGFGDPTWINCACTALQQVVRGWY